LYRAPDPGRRVAIVVFVCAADDPVQHVHCAVCAEGDEVERVDYGRDGGLAEEQELRDYADGFEDFGEDPESLEDYALVMGRGRDGVRLENTLRMGPCPMTMLPKIRYQIGAMTMLPRRQYMPNFQAFSRSRVRAYTLVIKKMMYRDDSV
jgi:hypothetical protein